jgi:hypothetical protein
MIANSVGGVYVRVFRIFGWNDSVDVGLRNILLSSFHWRCSSYSAFGVGSRKSR